MDQTATDIRPEAASQHCAGVRHIFQEARRGRRPTSGKQSVASSATIILVWSRLQDQLKSLPGEVLVVESDISVICAAASQRLAFQAVIADVIGPDGSERGYRLAHLLRTNLKISCPIYLISALYTASSRAYALQCGATKLLVDDPHLLDNLRRLVKDGGDRS